MIIIIIIIINTVKKNYGNLERRWLTAQKV